MCQFCFGALLDNRYKFHVQHFAGETSYQKLVAFGIYEKWRECPALDYKP
jgi:hypothetical protein